MPCGTNSSIAHYAQVARVVSGPPPAKEIPSPALATSTSKVSVMLQSVTYLGVGIGVLFISANLAQSILFFMR
jgi:hypothetical protein